MSRKWPIVMDVVIGDLPCECGGTFSVLDTGPGVVLHSMPPCQNFVRLDVLKYVCRQHKRIEAEERQRRN